MKTLISSSPAGEPFSSASLPPCVADINLHQNIMQHDINTDDQMVASNDTNLANAENIRTAESRKQRIAERQSYWTEARLAALNERALKHFDRVVFSILGLSMRVDISGDSDGLGYGWDEEQGADYVQLDDGENGVYGVNRRTGEWGREHGELWKQGDMISLAGAAFRIDDRLEAASRLFGYLNSEVEWDFEEIVRILIVQPKIKADPVPRPIGLGTNFLTWLSGRIDDRIANPAPEGRRA